MGSACSDLQSGEGGRAVVWGLEGGFRPLSAGAYWVIVRICLLFTAEITNQQPTQSRLTQSPTAPMRGRGLGVGRGLAQVTSALAGVAGWKRGGGGNLPLKAAKKVAFAAGSTESGAAASTSDAMPQYDFKHRCAM